MNIGAIHRNRRFEASDDQLKAITITVARQRTIEDDGQVPKRILSILAAGRRCVVCGGGRCASFRKPETRGKQTINADR
jgi:hypothetical protein